MVSAGGSSGWSEDPLEMVEEIVKVGGWELDAGTDELRWTHGTRRIFDVDADYDPTLDAAIQFFHEDDRPTIADLVEQCRVTGEPYNAELRIVSTEGNTRWVQVHGEPILDGDSITHIRGSIHDVTRRKEREQRLMVLNRVLRHNLRNDLNIIGGRAEILHSRLSELDVPRALRHDGDGELERLIEGLADAAELSSERVTALKRGIDNLANFPVETAKSEARTILETSENLVEIGTKARHFEEVIASENERRPIGIAPILERVATDLGRRYPDATIEVSGSLDQSVRGNGEMLDMVFRELVDNAIDHNDADRPTIEVAVSSSGPGSTLIEVRDDGPGIPALERRVLEGEEETPLVHGSGVGLWIVNWLVTRLEGTISIEESDRDGTEIAIELPQIP